MQRHPHHFKIALALAFSAGAPAENAKASAILKWWGCLCINYYISGFIFE